MNDSYIEMKNFAITGSDFTESTYEMPKVQPQTQVQSIMEHVLQGLLAFANSFKGRINNVSEAISGLSDRIHNFYIDIKYGS